jgi:ComF family protein
MRRQIGDALDVLYPPVCGLCGRPADSEDRLICRVCWSLIKGIEAPYCSACRKLLFDRLYCRECRSSPMVVFSLGYFDDRLQTIIHDLKFHGLKPLGTGLGRGLAELMAPWADRMKADFIIPVPLHESRRLSRGFNQAEEIGRELSHRLKIPLRSDLLICVRKTRQQAKLPAAQRELNVRGAFAVDDEKRILSGRRIILVDDVTTTGATLRENARVLRQAGAGKIIGAVAATAV